jgi:hypothetical protein
MQLAPLPSGDIERTIFDIGRRTTADVPDDTLLEAGWCRLTPG